MDWALLGWTTLAFFLAMGVGAHALDELQGRPLQTLIPARVLAALAAVSIAAACAIGCAIAVERTLWLLAFVAAGGFIVVAYNLELFGGAFHGGLWSIPTTVCPRLMSSSATAPVPVATSRTRCASRGIRETRQARQRGSWPNERSRA